MIVLPELAQKDLMHAIVNTVHTLVDTAGNPVVSGTISDAQLKMAALCAIQFALGRPIWPSSEKIVIQRRKQTDDIFVEA